MITNSDATIDVSTMADKTTYENPSALHKNQRKDDSLESIESGGYDTSTNDRFHVKNQHEGKTYPIREVLINLPVFLGGNGEIRFNAFTSLFGFAILWSLAAYCMAVPSEAGATLKQWMSEMTTYFTWFFIVANPVLIFFILWLAFRFGDIKMGAKDAQPEFSDTTYFAMIFSAGVAVGLFFYGVSEPLFHQSSNYFSEAGYHSQNEIDQWALVITMYHWGFAAWSAYLTVAISAGLASYRFGLPLTIRSSFYPLLGEYTWGWIGDLIDGFSIVMTVAGVCTSLGLGTLQMVAGMERLGWVSVDNLNDKQNVYIGVIWVITAGATISVVSGLKVGIKILSNVAFWLGCLILFLCFAMEKSYYLLNLTVQTTGMYLQWCIFQVPFWTDAFGSLNEGEGRAVDGNSSATWWIGGWTVFYMAWWVSWACFVGLFIAQISKNRSLRQVIFSVLVAPTIYAILWFTVFGGIALRQQRQGLELNKIGEMYYQNPDHFKVDANEFCYNVPQSDIIVNETTVFTNTLPGITPVCEFNAQQSTQAWFNVMYSFSYPDSNNFGGFGPIMSALSIITLVIYFITSSDSGSLVVDTIASNGRTEHHWLQRVFWSCTEGGLATALLVAGGSDALSALQAASIIFGLPFNLFLFLMCVSIFAMCRKIEEDQMDMSDPVSLLPKKTWTMPIYGGILNVFEFIFSLGMVHEARKERGMGLPSGPQVVEFIKALLVPFVPLYSILSITDPKQKYRLWNIFLTNFYAICFYASVGLWVCGLINNGFVALGWSAFFINACVLMNIRQHVRQQLGIQGNIIGDFFASSFMYPQALSQMVLQLAKEDVVCLHGD